LVMEFYSRIRLVCSEDGVWIGPTCVPITCPPPKIVYIGVYNCTNGFNIGSSCQFLCPGASQYRYSACKKDGSWSHRFQCSSPRTSCLSPPNMRDFHFSCPARLTPEDKQSTPNGEDLLVLRAVHNISCTVSSTLYPRPSALSCVRSCNKIFRQIFFPDVSNYF
uniref:Sushi domain-containing protein n=1 Tax=Gongylonema pulchrum TaxID=637853 RepID=A0A183EHR9_9BILA